MSCVVKVADFSSRSYWDNRFASEYAFEWLQPSSTILPTVKAEVQAQHRDDMAMLHLGSGSSDLSNHLRHLLFPEHNQDGCRNISSSAVILNVDFAAAAIETGRRREREEFGDARNGIGNMHWEVVDLLDWASFKRSCDEHCGRQFNLIVEKSCTDALACGADVQLGPFSEDERGIHISRDLYSRPFAPEVAVSIYLAAVTQPGGAWIALSYSAERFDFLRDAKQPAAAMWSIEQIQKVLAGGNVEGGDGRTVYRPEIVHFVYTIRRMPRKEE
ncbi:hypothetical protein JB92DRAFT_3116282 [Gautieria morchelliformis]|nr:hypothetical protein JB92DRAFT_3116282 [Gautieria morchelliformis]